MNQVQPDDIVTVVPVFVPITPVKAPDEQPIGADNNQTGVNWTSNTSSIAGVWDGSRLTDGRLNKEYLDISDTGEFTDEDYQADSHGNGQNCYLIDTFLVETDGNGQYVEELIGVAFDPRTFDLVLTW